MLDAGGVGLLIDNPTELPAAVARMDQCCGFPQFHKVTRCGLSYGIVEHSFFLL